MRILFWNCAMALPQKYRAVADLKPDIAVIAECAHPDILADKGLELRSQARCVWIGKNPNKGLGVFAAEPYSIRLSDPYLPYLKFIAPVEVDGPYAFNLLAVWAQNMSGGITRKNQLGPLRRALKKYRSFLLSGPTIIGGDFNSNAIWDKPGWRNNHMANVGILGEMDHVSLYHERTGELHGEESTPTHYWRDRRKDGPTYHIDYVFVSRSLLRQVDDFSVGSFEDWCGRGMSDHAALVVDITP